MTQGILLVGGKGTRLMPLTRTVPKPMLPLAGLPVTEHQLAMAKRAGITSIVLATSYLAEIFVPYFGDGSEWGMQIQYAVENEPLGTGGAIRNAAQLLNPTESIVILNGDVLSSHDLLAQIALHEAKDADVTLHLTHVADARAFGCVPVDSQGRVEAFLEKMEHPVANTINAGCYVFHPRVMSQIKPDTIVSVEREVFPNLLANGRKIFGVIDDSYWLDIGTPSALLQGSKDLVQSIARGATQKGADHHGSDYLALEGAQIDSSAVISHGSAIGRDVRIEAGARVSGSIVSDCAVISRGARVERCFVAAGTTVEPSVDICDSYLANDGVFSLLS